MRSGSKCSAARSRSRRTSRRHRGGGWPRDSSAWPLHFDLRAEQADIARQVRTPRDPTCDARHVHARGTAPDPDTARVALRPRTVCSSRRGRELRPHRHSRRACPSEPRVPRAERRRGRSRDRRGRSPAGRPRTRSDPGSAVPCRPAPRRARDASAASATGPNESVLGSCRDRSVRTSASTRPTSRISCASTSWPPPTPMCAAPATSHNRKVSLSGWRTG